MSKKGTGKGDKGASKGPAIPATDEEGYSNFSVADDTTNLVMTVEGKKLYLHRDVLVVKWPGLRSKLNNVEGGNPEDGLETSQIQSPRAVSSQEPQEVTLEDDKYSDILEALKCTYPPHKPISDEMVDSTVELVNKYEIMCLKEQCEEQLSKREHSLKLLDQAEKCQLHNLCDQVALTLATENTMASLEKHEDFDPLSPAMKAKLYDLRIQHLENEKAQLDNTCSHLYALTKAVIPIHKCQSVADDRFGYLVITTTGDDGKKKRETFSDSALIYHNEIDPKCKECVLSYGQECQKDLSQMDKLGCFEHVKKKFESEKKGKGKPNKK